jgi:hypothetical protein
MQTLLAFTWVGTKPTIALDVPSRPTVFTAFTTLNILTKFFEDFGVEKNKTFFTHLEFTKATDNRAITKSFTGIPVAGITPHQQSPHKSSSRLISEDAPLVF